MAVKALRANINETLPVCLIKEQGGKENPHEQVADECYVDSLSCTLQNPQ